MSEILTTSKIRSDYEKIWGKGPHLTVDALIKYGDNILLLKRNDGLYAMPGGFVEEGETLREAVSREVFEEVGISKLPEPIGFVVGDTPNRDPRSHIVTFAFLFEFNFFAPDVQRGQEGAPIWMKIGFAGAKRYYADHRYLIENLLTENKKK